MGTIILIVLGLICIVAVSRSLRSVDIGTSGSGSDLDLPLQE